MCSVIITDDESRNVVVDKGPATDYPFRQFLSMTAESSKHALQSLHAQICRRAPRGRLMDVRVKVVL